MKNFLRVFIPLFLANAIAFSSATQAGISVVVSPDNEASSMSKEEVTRLFLKKSKIFRSGVKAEPLDQGKGNDARISFYKEVVKKGPSQLSSYWSRMIFTGKGTPPKEVGDNENVIKSVSSNINAIGYIDTSSVDSRVKVLLTVN